MKFLFCPLASYGFVYPLIGIAHAVRSHGHDVAFVTGLEFAETLREMDMYRIPRDRNDGESFDVKFWGRPLSVGIQVKHIEYALNQFSADVLVTTQLALGPLLVGEMHKLPVAILGLAAYMWPPLWPSDYIPRSSRDLRAQWRYDEMVKIYNDSRSMVGLRLVSAAQGVPHWLGDLFMLQTVPELEQSEFDLPPQVHYVGSCIWEPEISDPELSYWLEESNAYGKPLIYAQPGKTFQFQSFWPSLREGLRNKPIRVAVALGKMNEDIGNIPPNFFVRSHIPLQKTLPCASAVIASGHTTSVLGALTYGLPSMLFPCGSASDDIAERCESVGAALCFYDYETGMSSELLEKTVGELLFDHRLKKQAENLQDAFARAGGINQAADLVEQLGLSFTA